MKTVLDQPASVEKYELIVGEIEMCPPKQKCPTINS